MATLTPTSEAPKQISSSGSLPLKDRVAIVTGASRGIGRAIAIHLASLGARIVVNYTSNSAQADIVVTQINDSSSSSTTTIPQAISIRADVSELDQVKFLFDSAEQAFNSPLYIFVNSAGIIDPKYPTLASTSLEDFDRIFRYSTSP